MYNRSAFNDLNGSSSAIIRFFQTLYSVSNFNAIKLREIKAIVNNTENVHYGNLDGEDIKCCSNGHFVY